MDQSSAMEGIFERVEQILSIVYEDCKKKSCLLEHECKHYANMLKDWKTKNSDCILIDNVTEAANKDSQCITKSHDALPLEKDFSIITQQELENIDQLLRKAKLTMHPELAEHRKRQDLRDSENKEKDAASTHRQNPRSKIPTKISTWRDGSLSRKSMLKNLSHSKGQFGNEPQSEVNLKSQNYTTSSKSNSVRSEPVVRANSSHFDSSTTELKEKEITLSDLKYQELLKKLKSSIQTYQDVLVSVESKLSSQSTSSSLSMKTKFYEDINRIIANTQCSEMQLCQKYIEFSGSIRKHILNITPDFNFVANGHLDAFHQPDIESLRDKMTELEKIFKLHVPDKVHENTSNIANFYNTLKKVNTSLWYPVIPLRLPTTAYYSDQTDLMHFAQLFQSLQWKSFLIDFKVFLFGELFPVLHTLDPKQEDFMYLFRSLYSLLCADGCKLPVLLEDRI